jgi:hypothetical protein
LFFLDFAIRSFFLTADHAG